MASECVRLLRLSGCVVTGIYEKKKENFTALFFKKGEYMKKIVIPILAVVFVLSLSFIAGAQSSSSGQSPTQPYGTYREGGSGESGGPTGSSQSGTSQQYTRSTSEDKKTGTDQGDIQPSKGKESQ